MRVVEVWLDEEFREYFYTREPMVRGYPIGDISKQLQFKKDHNCKSFKWFMDNIAYDVYYQFPKLPPNRAWGEVGHALFWSGLSVGLNECILFLLLFLSCDSPGSREVRGEGEEPGTLCKIWMMIGEHCFVTLQGAGRSEVRGRSLELTAKHEWWLVNIVLWHFREQGGQKWGGEPRTLCQMWMMIGERCFVTFQGAGMSEVGGGGGGGGEPRTLCQMWTMIGEHCFVTLQGAGRSGVRGRSLELFAKCERLVNILWQSREWGGQSAETHWRSGRGWGLELFTKCECEWWLVTWFCDSSRSGEARGAGTQWDRGWVEGPLVLTSVTMVVTTR